MKPILEEIHVENFKSFKNTTIRLNNFNVVVGPNASGKSNLVDFFRFLKKAIGEQLDPYAPYLEWWSYKNIVWGGREELPIKITLKFDVGGYKIIYYVAFAKEDIFRVLEERLEIPGYTKIERKGNLITIVNNP
ncbi:MAG: AAA family ATPase, partial [Thaumarchaeota archaeon]|nr:AAA family ATPase [Candidatus Geocrenenecus arthurdayi]